MIRAAAGLCTAAFPATWSVVVMRVLHRSQPDPCRPRRRFITGCTRFARLSCGPAPPCLGVVEMFDRYFRKEMEWAGKTLILETGKVARQADGAVVASYGDTVVLATVVGAKSPKPGIDFFPLTVNYQEKFFAAGRIPGGFFKREGRPTEKETLVSRLIDRPIRPLFSHGFKNEVQVIVT